MAKKNGRLKKEFHGRLYKDGNALDRADYGNMYRADADVHVPIDHVEVRKPRATQRRNRQR